MNKFFNNLNNESDDNFPKLNIGQFLISTFVLEVGLMAIKDISQKGSFYINEYGERVFDYYGVKGVSIWVFAIFVLIFMIGMKLSINTLIKAKEIQNQAKNIEITAEDIAFEKYKDLELYNFRLAQKLFYLELILYIFLIWGLLI